MILFSTNSLTKPHKKVGTIVVWVVNRVTLQALVSGTRSETTTVTNIPVPELTISRIIRLMWPTSFAKLLLLLVHRGIWLPAKNLSIYPDQFLRRLKLPVLGDSRVASPANEVFLLKDHIRTNTYSSLPGGTVAFDQRTDKHAIKNAVSELLQTASKPTSSATGSVKNFSARMSKNDIFSLRLPSQLSWLYGYLWVVWLPFRWEKLSSSFSRLAILISAF